MAALPLDESQLNDEYISVIEADPNLSGVSSMAELHVRLLSLSEACTKEDKAKSNVFEQLTFDGTNPNPIFEPNLFKRDVGCDGRKVTTYYRYAIKSEEHVIAAVEYACDKNPSLLLPASTSADMSMGALYQGGFKTVGNLKFLSENNITLIVNTAKALDAFFPKFKTYVDKAKKGGVTFLELGWVDDHTQEIVASQLEELVHSIHQARSEGGSVLIHCAQGRSRSATASAAYVASILGTRWLVCDEDDPIKDRMGKTFQIIQEGRRMAKPNNNFEAQLRAHSKGGLFDKLAAELEKN